MGCLLVVDAREGRLLGTFTDGDLRRTLQGRGAQVRYRICFWLAPVQCQSYLLQQAMSAGGHYMLPYFLVTVKASGTLQVRLTHAGDGHARGGGHAPQPAHVLLRTQGHRRHAGAPMATQ